MGQTQALAGSVNHAADDASVTDGSGLVASYGYSGGPASADFLNVFMTLKAIVADV